MQSDYSVEVHPLVLVKAADAWLNRTGDDARVIGAILGKVEGSKIELKNAFLLKHGEEGGKISEKTFTTFKNIYRRRYPNLEVVGWFSSEARDNDEAFHGRFITGLKRNLIVHMIVDPKAAPTEEIPVSIVRSLSLSIGSHPTESVGLTIEKVIGRLSLTPSEMTCLTALSGAQSGAIQPTLQKLGDELQSLAKISSECQDECPKTDIDGTLALYRVLAAVETVMTVPEQVDLSHTIDEALGFSSLARGLKDFASSRGEVRVRDYEEDERAEHTLRGPRDYRSEKEYSRPREYQRGGDYRGRGNNNYRDNAGGDHPRRRYDRDGQRSAGGGDRRQGQRGGQDQRNDNSRRYSENRN